MNTLTEPQRPDLDTALQHLPLPGRTPRTALADRLALQLALRLLLWSTRPLPAPQADAHRRRLAARAREQRELDWQRARHLLPFD